MLNTQYLSDVWDFIQNSVNATIVSIQLLSLQWSQNLVLLMMIPEIF